jgi:hypothetical protein
MKKLIILLLCCITGIQNGFSQKSEMSSAELKFRNSIEQFLKEEGFVPTIDDDDNSLNFKKEGSRYWLTVQEDNPYYIRLHKSGFTMKDTNRTLMLEACNYANANKRCGKACVGAESVFFVVECYCHSIGGFKNTFYDNMRAVDRMKTTTSDYYNEHDK